MTYHALLGHYDERILCHTSCTGTPFEPYSPQTAASLKFWHPVASCRRQMHSVVGSLGALAGRFACRLVKGIAFLNPCR
jgi:hypothetical protein